MADPPAQSLDGPTVPNPVIPPQGKSSPSDGVEAAALSKRVLALRAERDTLKEKLQNLRARTATESLRAPESEAAQATGGEQADAQSELLVLRERSKASITGLREELAWAYERIAALGATRAAGEKKLHALRLLNCSTGSAPAGDTSAARVIELEAELQQVRTKLTDVDEERQHLSVEIQRMVDRS